MPELETLIASIMYLMTRHAKAPKANLENAITGHLQLLCTHPDCNSKVIKDAAERLSMCWKQEARLKEIMKPSASITTLNTKGRSRAH